MSRLPSDIRQRLHNIFAQIEREFDLLYAENQRLQEKLNLTHADEDTDEASSSNTNINNNNESRLEVNMTNEKSLTKKDSITKKKNKKSDTNNNNNNNNTSSSSNGSSPKSKNPKQQQQSTSLTTSVSSSMVATVPPPASSAFVNNSLASTLTNTAASALASTSSSAKSAILSSKTRINNLSFPKFKPNAREFIMQSIKNTSAQLVNKTTLSHHNFNSKLQCSLSGHKDGIWDISLIQIPSNLLSQNGGGVGNGLASASSSNLSNYYNHYNNYNHGLNASSNSSNLLVGTASADNTARLWYLNSHMSHQQQSMTNFQPMSPLQQQQNYSVLPNSGQQLTTTAFCIQEYSGHTGI